MLNWWRCKPKIKKPEPKTLIDCLRQSAEFAMDRGDLVTRSDCYQAIREIQQLREQLAKARAALERAKQ